MYNKQETRGQYIYIYLSIYQIKPVCNIQQISSGVQSSVSFFNIGSEETKTAKEEHFQNSEDSLPIPLELQSLVGILFRYPFPG